MTSERMSHAPGVNFKTDGNFAIHVTDIRKAEDFYSTVLGFKLLRKSQEQLEYDTGAVRLYVNQDDRVVPFIPALEVKDYEEAKAHLIANGCTILKEFEGHKALYFADSFGITIDIIERKPSSKRRRV
jgi:catechol 2,3-dioxygenase-like lactoylglutathione lyase family enzyme